MNENIDLTKILKDCPIGWEFYSSVYGNVTFRGIENDSEYPIKFFFLDEDNIEKYGSCTEQGLYAPYYKGECTFFPSKEQRDWNKFIAPWYKKERFDPKTLKPFDEVLVFDSDTPWTPLMFSYLEYSLNYPRMQCFDFTARKVIPYNKETEHLLGTHNEAPEYYRYWED